MPFNELRPKKLKTLTDTARKEYAVVLTRNVPVRIHSTNGGYMFSVIATDAGICRYVDKRWGDRRKLKAKRITWDNLI